jgi:hypothetical protein
VDDLTLICMLAAALPAAEHDPNEHADAEADESRRVANESPRLRLAS